MHRLGGGLPCGAACTGSSLQGSVGEESDECGELGREGATAPSFPSYPVSLLLVLTSRIVW